MLFSSFSFYDGVGDIMKRIIKWIKPENEEVNYWKLILVIFLGVIFIAFIIHLFGWLWSLTGVGIGTFEGWLGFWGSYLGGSIGAVGVIFTTYWIIKTQSKKEERDYKQQLVLAKLNLLQEVKINQIENKLNSLERTIINIEKYCLVTVRLIEHYDHFETWTKERDKALKQNDNLYYERANNNVYREMDSYNKLLNERILFEQVIKIEIPRIVSIKNFFQVDNEMLLNLYDELKEIFKSHGESLNNQNFTNLNKQEIYDMELMYSGFFREELDRTFEQLEGVLNDWKLDDESGSESNTK